MHCFSWLGEKAEAKKRRDQDAQRNIFTAPAGASKGRDDTRDIKTAPAPGDATQSADDIVQVGIFFKKKRDVDPNKVHMDIYSKRNMYSSLQRERTSEFSEAARVAKEEEEKRQKEWEEEAERQRQEIEEQQKQEEIERKAEVALAEERRRAEAADVLTLDRRAATTNSVDSETRRRHTIRAEMRRIAGVGPQSELEKREARIRAMNDNAELMKDILIRNAKKRASQKKKKQPLEERIRGFFTRIEDLQNLEAFETSQPTSKEQQRRYVLMTKGVKAALEITDDDDVVENPLHTF